MTEFDSVEQAYKNGYSAAKKELSNSHKFDTEFIDNKLMKYSTCTECGTVFYWGDYPYLDDFKFCPFCGLNIYEN